MYTAKATASVYEKDTICDYPIVVRYDIDVEVRDWGVKSIYTAIFSIELNGEALDLDEWEIELPVWKDDSLSFVHAEIDMDEKTIDF
jgi:hypothetical protein